MKYQIKISGSTVNAQYLTFGAAMRDCLRLAHEIASSSGAKKEISVWTESKGTTRAGACPRGDKGSTWPVVCLVG